MICIGLALDYIRHYQCQRIPYRKFRDPWALFVVLNVKEIGCLLLLFSPLLRYEVLRRSCT
jgi:hypothetical protein